MFRKILKLRRRKVLNSKLRLDEREQQILLRENLEANRAQIDSEQVATANGNRMMDRVNSPGVVTGMGSIVARTAKEQRARNKP